MRHNEQSIGWFRLFLVFWGFMEMVTKENELLHVCKAIFTYLIRTYTYACIKHNSSRLTGNKE